MASIACLGKRMYANIPSMIMSDELRQCSSSQLEDTQQQQQQQQTDIVEYDGSSFLGQLLSSHIDTVNVSVIGVIGCCRHPPVAKAAKITDPESKLIRWTHSIKPIRSANEPNCHLTNTVIVLKSIKNNDSQQIMQIDSIHLTLKYQPDTPSLA